MIKGIPITLYDTTVTGQDDFGADIVEETEIIIDNVIVGQPSSDDIVSEMSVSGKRIAYNLCIPANDAHEWENKTVGFYGRKWRVIGIPTQFIDGFMGKDFPWNKQVRVEKYE
jgi:hypothetical protein